MRLFSGFKLGKHFQKKREKKSVYVAPAHQYQYSFHVQLTKRHHISWHGHARRRGDVIEAAGVTFLGNRNYSLVFDLCGVNQRCIPQPLCPSQAFIIYNARSLSNDQY